MPAGLISIDIEARLAKLEEGVTQANRTLDTFGKTIDRLGAKAKAAFSGFAAGIAAGFSASAIRRLVTDVVDAADHLNNLSKATGIAVETLGGIGLAAAKTGTNLDDAAKAIGHLQQQIAAANTGNEQAISNFAKLGITIKDLKTLTTDQIFAKLADAFQATEDGFNKAAGGAFFFKKSYQGIIPLLDEGGQKLQQNIDYFTKFGGVTKEVAEQSTQFNETLTKLQLLNGAFGRTLAATLLPALQALADHLVIAKEKGEGFSQFGHGLGLTLRALAAPVILLTGGFVALGEAIGATAAVNAAFLRGDFAGAKAIGAGLLEQLDSIGNRYSQLAKKVLLGTEEVSKAGAKTATTTGKKPFPSFGGTGGTDDTAKRLLDQQIKAFEAAIKSEQEVLRDREHFLQTYYQDDVLGIKEYFTTRQEVIASALAKEVAAYDGIIAALEERKGKADPKERIDLETRIADAVEKRSRAEQSAAVKGIGLWIDEQKAVEGFRRKLEEVALQLSQLSGDQVTSASFGFDLQNAELLKRIALEKQSSDEQIRKNAELFDAKMGQLRAITIAQAGLNEASTKYGLVLDSVSNAQARVNIAVQSGSITELEGLARLSAVNRSRLDDLQKQVDAATEAAKAVAALFGAESLAAQTAFRDVDALKLKMEELAATGDLVAKKFNEIGSSSFSSFLQDLTSGKGFSASLKNLGNSLFSSINKVVSDSLAQKAFGKDGPLSGFGDIFSKLFGGGTGAGLTGSATALLGSASALTAAAAALTASAGVSTGSAAFGLAGKLFSSGSGSGGFEFDGGFGAGEGFAKGTPFVPRDMIAKIHKGEAIIPAHRNRNGGYNPRIERSITYAPTINVLPGASTATGRQASKQAGDKFSSQMRRG